MDSLECKVWIGQMTKCPEDDLEHNLKLQDSNFWTDFHIRIDAKQGPFSFSWERSCNRFHIPLFFCGGPEYRCLTFDLHLSKDKKLIVITAAGAHFTIETESAEGAELLHKIANCAYQNDRETEEIKVHLDAFSGGKAVKSAQ